MMLKKLALLGWPVEGCSWACESMKIRSLSGAQFPSPKAASGVNILYAQTDNMLDNIYFLITTVLVRWLVEGCWWVREPTETKSHSGRISTPLGLSHVHISWATNGQHGQRLQ